MLDTMDKWLAEDVAFKAKATAGTESIVKAIDATNFAFLASADDRYFSGATFSVDGADFRISFNKRDRRWVLGVKWHEGYDHCRESYDAEKTEITCSEERTPEQIAADFRRRLLPVGKKLQPLAVAALQRQTNYRNNVLALAKELADASGETQSNATDSTPKIRVYRGKSGVYGEFVVSSDDSVQIELRSCNPALAKQILDLIRETKKATNQ